MTTASLSLLQLIFLFSEDRARRFEACGWQTITVEDGNDLESIEHAIRSAQAEELAAFAHPGEDADRFRFTAQTGFFESHGSPLGVEEVKLTKTEPGMAC